MAKKFRLKRNNFPLSHNILNTQKLGALCPVGVEVNLPADKFVGTMQALVKFDSLVHAGYYQFDIHSFGIHAPLRLLWTDYEAFVTGGETGDERPVPPYIEAPADTGWTVGSLGEQLGFDIGIPGLKCSALPFRLYALWYNTYVRDPILQPELPISTASGLDTVTNTQLMQFNWQKDRFTTARPFTQLGDEIVVPLLGNNAPVVGNGMALGITDGTKNAALYYNSNSVFNSNIGGYGEDVGTTETASIGLTSSKTVGITSDSTKSGMVADLTQVSGVSPMDLKFALAQQTWKTRRSLYGSKLRDLLSFMGVRYSDARLENPITFMHRKTSVDITEVLQTAPSADSFVGNQAGRGTGYNGSNRYNLYCEEWGLTMFLCAVTTKPFYMYGMDPQLSFEVREDLYVPELAHAGLIPIKNKEIRAKGTDSDEETWGWTMYGDQFRTRPNRVHGAFRTTEKAWHTARDYADGAVPPLNGDFITMNPTTRIFNNESADDEQTGEKQRLKMLIRHNISARRILTKNGDPSFNI